MSEAFNEAMMPTDYISPTHQMSPERTAEMVAMAAAVEAFASRPANLRDPESKKVLCRQCRTRMTLAEFRLHKHVIRLENLNLPHAPRQRKNPHFSKRRLRLVERTRRLLPPFGEDFNEDDIMYVVKETRVKAAREIRKETDEAAKKKRMQQKASRKANRA